VTDSDGFTYFGGKLFVWVPVALFIGFAIPAQIPYTMSTRWRSSGQRSTVSIFPLRVPFHMFTFASAPVSHLPSLV
ncbi:MAG: hypothetical protein AAF194_05780, partial [Pseudomonadota bacterium]